MRLLPRLLLILASVFPVAFFVQAALRKSDRQLLVPGPTSSGHHQIESKCELCHTPWSGVKEDACTGCHSAALT